MQWERKMQPKIHLPGSKLHWTKSFLNRHAQVYTTRAVNGQSELVFVEVHILTYQMWATHTCYTLISMGFVQDSHGRLTLWEISHILMASLVNKSCIHKRYGHLIALGDPWGGNNRRYRFSSPDIAMLTFTFIPIFSYCLKSYELDPDKNSWIYILLNQWNKSA